METYGPKLKCVDLEASYNLLGNFNTELASNLMVVFERCDTKVPGNNCAGDAEFKDWLASKYLITLKTKSVLSIINLKNKVWQQIQQSDG